MCNDYLVFNVMILLKSKISKRKRKCHLDRQKDNILLNRNEDLTQ